MSLLDVTRELHRTQAHHVRVVLLDFFAGNPPSGEVNTVVQLTEDLSRAFAEVKTTPVPEPIAHTAPEEPKEG